MGWNRGTENGANTGSARHDGNRIFVGRRPENFDQLGGIFLVKRLFNQQIKRYVPFIFKRGKHNYNIIKQRNYVTFDNDRKLHSFDISY